MRQSETLDTLVGVAMCALIVLIIAAGVSDKLFGGPAGYVLEARFDQADGLAPGSPIYLAGVRVGRVEKLRLNPKTLKPVAVFRIDDGVRLPVDTAAMIMSDGMLGGKYVKLEPGAEDKMFKPGGRFEFVQDSVIVETVLERIVRMAEARRDKLQEQDKPKQKE